MEYPVTDPAAPPTLDDDDSKLRALVSVWLDQVESGDARCLADYVGVDDHVPQARALWDEDLRGADLLALVEFAKSLPETPQVTTRLYPVDLEQVQERLSTDLAAGYDVALHLGQSPGSAAIGWSRTNWTQSWLASMAAQLFRGSV